MSRYKVLSTKKLDTALVEQLKNNSIDIIEHDFISTRPVTDEKLRDKISKYISREITAVFTSANAVISVQQYLNAVPAWKVFCLSGKTKEAVLHKFHPEQVAGVAVDAAELGKKIIGSNTKEVVFFCGDIRRDELPSMLEKNGVKVDEKVVYHTLETPVSISATYDAVLFFSPSAVKSFFAANQLSPSVVCFTIGNTTDKELKQYTGNKTIIAKTPSQEQLATELLNYFNQPVQS